MVQDADTVRDGWQDAAIEADYWWQRYVQADTLPKQADALVRLANSMSDLRSWLPGYDYESGTMLWEREDEEPFRIDEIRENNEL